MDILKVFDSLFITGHRTGLKTVAPLAGFVWPVEDAGGEEAMIRYAVAVAAEDEAERELARGWLLAYNRGDVETNSCSSKLA
ncbi:MAG: hypothetical protein ACRDZ3_14920 [Acidimicrobiia bacterium]